MAVYMKILGVVLVCLGLAGSIYCCQGVSSDQAYFKAARGLERYPGNVLYLQELKMAEPRHMLLLAGAWTAAPAGAVLGSMAFALGGLLAVSRRG